MENVIIIEMPNAEEVRAVSVERNEELGYLDKIARTLEEKKASDDLIRLIQFINHEIDEAKMNGKFKINFSFDDEQFDEHDIIRCPFTLHGHFSTAHAEFLTLLYRSLGFKGAVNSYSITNNFCYRTGEVILSWY